MKKTIATLLLCAIPVLSLADADHDMKDMHHDMKEMHEDMEKMHHDSDSHTDEKRPAQVASAGRPGNPPQVSRTIAITMDDTMRFTPDRITVKKGETIRFFIRNTGKVSHEMVLGTLKELQEHAEMMRKMPGMKHAEPNMVTLAASKRGGLVWTFDQQGTVDFACLVPGHMEAGMRGRIVVE